MTRLFLLLRRMGAVVLVLLLAVPLSAANFEPLRTALERAATRIPGHTNGVSVEVVDDETGESVFERFPDAPQTIASITKLITTASAIHYLGPDYRFKTSFWRHGDVQQGVLNGSLLVVGGGDPNISGRFYGDNINAVFDKWAEGLQQAGVSRVTGDILLNATFFDSIGR
ncbi:MAG TPA: D-alanyl-D-alanine carboxypeptidase, partial [Thermoanaerobaculia bacterium]